MAFWSSWFIPKPFNEGYLPELDGHKVYFREFGNPKGEPIVCFHGGPGFWSRAETAKKFNLKKYRIIMFDQRGCGKSKPAGYMEHNTTQDNVDDVVRLLELLEINNKVILFGGSWGSTMALMFAISYPKVVKALILSKIFLANKDSQNWELKQSGLFYPDMLEGLKGNISDNYLIPEYYAKQINSENLEQQTNAATKYGCWERILGSLDPKFGNYIPDEKEINMQKIYINYAAQNFMMEDDEIIDNAVKIAHIPTLIVHNRLDFICPPINAYRLHKVLPMSKLIFVPAKGHSSKLLDETLCMEMKEFLQKLERNNDGK